MYANSVLMFSAWICAFVVCALPATTQAAEGESVVSLVPIVVHDANSAVVYDFFNSDGMPQKDSYSYLFYNNSVVGTNTTCAGHQGLRKFTFESGKGAVYLVSCKGRLQQDMCVCAENGECFTVRGSAESVDLTPQCDAKGCHFYLFFVSSHNGTVVGDKGTVLPMVLEEALGSDSRYVKAAAVSCSGCSKIKGAKC